MAKAVSMETADRCELCGARVGNGFAERMRHLRGSHPAYARGLLLRLAAPGVFLVLVLGLSVARAPQWAYVVAVLGSFGLLLLGKLRSRTERAKAGAAPTLPLGRLLRDGGLAVLLVVPLIVMVLFLLSRR